MVMLEGTERIQFLTEGKKEGRERKVLTEGKHLNGRQAGRKRMEGTTEGAEDGMRSERKDGRTNGMTEGHMDGRKVKKEQQTMKE